MMGNEETEVCSNLKWMLFLPLGWLGRVFSLWFMGNVLGLTAVRASCSIHLTALASHMAL